MFVAFVMFVAAPPALAQCSIRLTGVPADTPAGAAVYVAGDFNGWDPRAAGYEMTAEAGGKYALTLPATVRGPIEFKFTLGSWETVETTAAGADVENRAFVVPATGEATYTGSVGSWRAVRTPPPPTTTTAGAAAATRPASTATASVSILSNAFAMPQLGRARRVWIYLPPGYAKAADRYPVLYLQDGQNIFDAATSFAGEWGVDETLDALRAGGDRGCIVVAVDNGGAHRLDEYNPWVNPVDPKWGGGEGDKYVEFLVRTLKPYVDAHYRTRADRLNTGVGGSSAGGLIALYAALKYPDVFGRAAVFSCASWLARPRIFDYARRAKVPADARFYFVSGTRETAGDASATAAAGTAAADPIGQAELADILVANGLRRDVAVRSKVAPDGKHAEWFWRREFPDAYRWLFGGGGAAPSPREDRER